MNILKNAKDNIKMAARFLTKLTYKTTLCKRREPQLRNIQVTADFWLLCVTTHLL